MSNDFNLKNLWKQQGAIPPAIETVLNHAHRFKRRQIMQAVLSNLLLIGTGIFIGWIVWCYQPELWTTKVGVALVLLAMLLIIGFQSYLLPLLLQDNNHLDNKAYLEWLQQVEVHKNRLQKQLMSLYFVLLSSGIALYFYEYTLKMPPLWAWSCYGLTTLWIAFNWWYLRPRIIQKQQVELQALQDALKNLIVQWEELP